MDYVCDHSPGPRQRIRGQLPNFPGCITAGRTLDEAKALALEALTRHIGVMREAGEPVPAPSTLDEGDKRPAVSDGVAFLVHVKERHPWAQADRGHHAIKLPGIALECVQ